MCDLVKLKINESEPNESILCLFYESEHTIQYCVYSLQKHCNHLIGCTFVWALILYGTGVLKKTGEIMTLEIWK